MESLKRFAEGNNPAKTFLALDLDGTALLEDHGKVFISSSVEKGVKAIHDFNVPVVLNTSFNGPEEPIVRTPSEAVAMYRRSGLDALVLGDLVVTDRLKALDVPVDLPVAAPR